MAWIWCRTSRRRKITTGDETTWTLGAGYGAQEAPRYKVVALDFGVKRNILRLLADAGCAVTVVPATASAEAILALKPDGVFLSNGPGDPAETGKYAVPTIQKILAAKVPTFGICLGHQMMALAVGAKTMKMHQGHHGANHPVQDFTTNKVEIVSMNHGFAVDPASLPENAVETHKSLFDGRQLRHRPDRPSGFFGAASPRSLARPAGQPLSFARFVDDDGKGQDGVRAGSDAPFSHVAEQNLARMRRMRGRAPTAVIRNSLIRPFRPDKLPARARRHIAVASASPKLPPETSPKPRAAWLSNSPWSGIPATSHPRDSWRSPGAWFRRLRRSGGYAENSFRYSRAHPGRREPGRR